MNYYDRSNMEKNTNKNKKKASFITNEENENYERDE